MQILIGTLFLSLATQALAAAVLEERAQCNADNCLRNLRDQRYSSSASVFCSEWLRSTLTNTISVLSTVSVTATITPPHATVTSVSSSIQTITATITQTTTITAPNGGGGMTIIKREIIGYPAWLSATYPATRVSSACSCFISDANPPFPATTTVTATNILSVTITLPTVTDTITSVVPTQSTSTATSIVTATVCETPRILASGLCYDLRSDENNCGAVGYQCANGATCANGICTKGSCSTNPSTFRCDAAGTNDGCFCWVSTDGYGFCGGSSGSCSVQCPGGSSSECPLGQLCVVVSVCGGSGRTCVKSPNTCNNGSAALKLFKKRAKPVQVKRSGIIEGDGTSWWVAAH